ncbi:MAG: 8-oxo-dGTP diphosphatase [Erysipelotrichales bacterium]|nr:8-oxo-dGTP diphosphatase [Erysipelotrichales bacterium]
MSKVENVELTVLCLVTQGNQILLQNRVKRDWRGYTLPGGHVEKGESIVEAVIREMREETGLTILHPTLCGVKQFPIEEGRYIVFLFKCHEFTGELVSSQEGEMVWVDREHLDEYTTVDDFMELLQVMESDDLTEFIYVIENEEWKVILK